ncbi:MAG: glycosyltransferase family 4 protein [Chloroflexota bacterium]|jgi:glycosyltransferase involved in cell wall biosynthesis
MNIALLHYSSPPVVGGVESVMAHHARLLTNAGHRVVILTGRGEVFDERIPVRVLPRLDSRHAEVIEVKTALDGGTCTPAFDNLRSQIKSELLNELNKVDVLAVHNVASLHKNLPLTAALHEAMTLPNFPRVILWHHDLAWTTPRYRAELHEGHPWDLLRSNWKGAAQVVVSELRRRELAELIDIPKESIRVIPNGVDLDTFYKFEKRTSQLVAGLNLKSADPLFLLPVRLTPRKNIEQALHILAELRNHFPNAMLLVTGPQGPHNPANLLYKNNLFELRDQLKLQGSAHFLAESTSEFLPDAVIADFYRLADALLLPSREEGFGIPMIEAAFSHIPVFCADIPALRELGNEDVSFFDPDEAPQTVAKQIIQRLETEAASRLARRAKHGYTWEQIHALHIAPLIQEMIA